jgi:hypothetical protein
MAMSAGPRTPGIAAAPWDLDALSPEELQASLIDLSGFVGWLRECDIDVPSCWHFHGWLVRRLLVLRHWREDVLDVEARAKAANDWWSALSELQRDWEEVRSHRGAHPPREEPWGNPVVTPALEDTVSEAVRRRRGRRGNAPW